MSFKTNIEIHLKNQGADFIYFVDISRLPEKQNKGFPNAILFGIALSRKYIQLVSDTPNYVEKMKQSGQIQNDEFHLTEIRTDRMADELAIFLKEKGYDAYSQSEINIKNTGYYNQENQVTPLPHKTIAGLAGLGWIGKHNLLVTKEFGSAISMCSVLSSAPLKTTLQTPLESQCKTCKVCVEICPTKALSGHHWNKESTRDNLLNHKKCVTCLECMVNCPWTQKTI